MATENLIEIEKLQNNLPSLRKLAGWTAEDLGDKVGVTKQTISNLETGRTKMSKIQYIAIRAVLDYEAQSNQNLASALHLVLDDRDATKAEHKENEDKVKTVAAATAVGVNSSALSAILGVASVALGAWLAVIMDKDK
ncbi:helix-turn-helix transcriptional regulator [Bacillota bacterium HCP3S3_F1_1]|jgi:transcriptional regulator with XRE-family HTH domain